MSPKPPKDLPILPKCGLRCGSEEHSRMVQTVLTQNWDETTILAYITALCANYVNNTASMGFNALHLAASCGKLEVVRWILAKNPGFNLDFKDRESGFTALHRALFYGQLTVARELIKNGASLASIADRENLPPIEILEKDIPLEWLFQYPDDYDRYRDPDKPCYFPKELSVWGENTNYNLGQVSQQELLTPDHQDFFKRSRLMAKEVSMNKFHTVFLTDSGRVFACGHGHGGRLGMGDNDSRLSPTIVSPLQRRVCVAVSAGTDHTLFCLETPRTNILTKYKSEVYSCGLNSHHQLGIHPEKPFLLNPSRITLKGVLTNKGNELPSKDIVSISAGKYHSVIATNECVLTFGTNYGQMGLNKSDAIVVMPKVTGLGPHLVKGYYHRYGYGDTRWKIEKVATSEGATAVLTNKGVYVFSQYHIRELNTEGLYLSTIGVTGGRLACEEHRNDPFVTVCVLDYRHHIYVWKQQEDIVTNSDFEFVKCLFVDHRHTLISDFAFFKDGFLLAATNGQCYMGKLLSRKVKKRDPDETRSLRRRRNQDRTVMTSYDFPGCVVQGRRRRDKRVIELKREPCAFIDLDELQWVGLERVELVNRAYKVFSDPEGRNFAVTQIHSNRTDIPNGHRRSTRFTGIRRKVAVRETSFMDEMAKLLRNVSSADDIHDVVLEVGNRQFPAHRVLLAMRSEYFHELLIGKKEARPKTCLNSSRTRSASALKREREAAAVCPMNVRLDKVDPDRFVQMLKYIYTDYCPYLACVYYDDNHRLLQDEFERNKAEKKVLAIAARDLKLYPMEQMLTHKYLAHANDKWYTSKLQEAVAKARTDEDFLQFGDIQLKSTDDEFLVAHKCILTARSEYFEAMLSHNWQECQVTSGGGDKRQKMQTIKMSVPTDVLDLVLTYIYTDGVGNKLDNKSNLDFACQVLITADELLLFRLKDMCELAISKMLTLRNYVEVLNFADMYNAVQLKETILHFIALNLAYLLEARELDGLPDATMQLVTDYYRALLPAMARRKITPFYTEVTEEEAKLAIDGFPKDYFDLTRAAAVEPGGDSANKSKKKAKRYRKTSAKVRSGDKESSPLKPGSPSRLRLDSNCSVQSEDLDETNEDRDISSLSSPIAIPAGARAAQSSPSAGLTPVSPSVASALSCASPGSSAGAVGGSWAKVDTGDVTDFRSIMQSERRVKSAVSANKLPTSQENRNFVRLGAKDDLLLSDLIEIAENQHQPPPPPQSPALAWGLKSPSSAPSDDASFMDIMSDQQKSNPKPASLKSTSAGKTAPRTNAARVIYSAAPPRVPDFNSIMREEERRVRNLHRSDTMPMDMILIEERAIEELRKHYANKGEEKVTVERVIDAMADPVWKGKRDKQSASNGTAS